MNSPQSRIAAARHLLADYERAVDKAFRNGDRADWYQQSKILAGALRTVCALASDAEQMLGAAAVQAADNQAKLAEVRAINLELARCLEIAMAAIGSQPENGSTS